MTTIQNVNMNILENSTPQPTYPPSPTPLTLRSLYNRAHTWQNPPHKNIMIHESQKYT